MKKKIIFIFVILILIGGSFGSGYFFGQAQKICPFCKPESVNFSLFWEAWATLQDNFVNPEKMDVQKMIYGAISGMVNSLGDPYTVFLSPDETEKFNNDVQGTFEGIGAEVGIKKGQLTIIAPLEGTPAQNAGLRAGDKILKINDKLTSDLTIDEAVDLMRGKKGTSVTLTIYRDEWTQSKEIKIVRDVIEVPSLKWELKDNKIAYIKLYQFSGKASSDFSQAAVQILASQADRIILDLRNNPGGYLEVAQNIAGWFLKNGDTVLIEDLGKENKQETYKAEGNSKLLPYPVVILINQGSASASEILAGALKDDRGIKLIGETSFGKGSVQELNSLTGGSSLKITIAKWLTPNGNLIAEKGLEPDVKVEMTDADFESGKDPQLDKAVEIIKGF